MADFLIKVNIPVNGADVVCLIIVLALCAFAVHVIRGFFRKPEVKHRDQVPVRQENDIEINGKDGGSNG
ncbi:MAG: hypothetical protein ACI4CS_05850 [Candidatus Weimeria sp.]